MKKRTKIMLALLSSAMIAAGAAGLAGCKKGNSSSASSVEETYQSYVAYAEENNLEVLSYDEWIQAILGASKPGPQGPAGPAGPAGPTGPQGEDGEAADPITVTKVEVKDGKLVITYSDGSEQEADLPDEITHVHKYNENNIQMLIPFSEDNDGLGYMVCTEDGCEHIELVVMKRAYDITVKMGGEPMQNIDVVINGVTATTDSNGVAQIMNFGEFNDYIVSVGTPGYATTQLYRTGLRFGVEMEIEISKSFTDAQDVNGESNIDYYVEIEGAGNYVADLETEILYGSDTVNNKELRLYGGETEAKYYKITSSSPYFSIQDRDYNGAELVENGEAFFAVQAGETQKVYLSGNMLALSQAQFNFGENLMYPVKVEEVEAPAAGSKRNRAIVAANEFMTLPEASEEDGWVYYRWTNYNANLGAITITIEGAEVEFNTKTCTFQPSFSLTDDPAINVVSDEQFTLVNGSTAVNARDPYFLRARPTGSGEHKFRLNAEYVKGTIPNPETVNLNDNGPTSFEGSGATTIWAKLVVPATGIYVIQANHKLVEGVPEVENPIDVTEYSSSAVAVYNLTEGVDYYVRITGNNGANITFRHVTDSEQGRNIALAIELTGENVPTFTNGRGTIAFDIDTYGYGTDIYYAFAAPEDGTLTVEGYNMMDSYSVYIGDGYETQKEYKAGETIIVRLNYNGWDEGTTNLPLNWMAKQTVTPVDPDNPDPDNPDPDNPDNPDDPPAPQAVEHTFKVVDDAGAPVSGVVVTVNGVASEATGADGVAKLTVVNGAYTIQLSGYDTDTYYYERALSTRSGQTSGYELTLRTDKQTYNFALQSGGEALNLSGATLRVMNGSAELATATVTDGRASVTVYFPSNSSRLTYELTLTEAQAQDYSLPNGVRLEFAQTADQEDIKVNLVANETYTVSLVNENGNAVSSVGVVIRYGTSSGRVVARGTTDANGTVSVKTAPLTGNETYVVVFTGVPSGYRIAGGQLSATVTSLNAVMREGDNEATGSNIISSVAGSALENASYVLTAGNNVINNPYAESSYAFRAPLPGRYSFTARNVANNGYFSYLCFIDSNGDGRGKDFIRNGMQVYAGNNIVLGAKRDYNKAYELAIDLKAGDIIVLAFHTDTAEGGSGNIIVSSVQEEGATTIREGVNTVNLVNGTASAYLNTRTGYEVTFTWEGDVTVTVDGEPYESGTALGAGGGRLMEVVLTSSALTEVRLTVTFTVITGPGDY